MKNIYSSNRNAHLPTHNIFDIRDNIPYTCNLLHYQIGHSLLIVEVTGDPARGTFYLLFENIQYFEGPISWESANFGIGRSDECIELLRRIKSYDSFSEEYLLKKFTLFTAETDRVTVKILSQNAGVVEDIPEDFVDLID